MVQLSEVCIRFLLLSQSLIKRAHPLCQAAVTRREGGVTQSKSAAGERQVNQEVTRQTWNMDDELFRIKESLLDGVILNSLWPFKINNVHVTGYSLIVDVRYELLNQRISLPGCLI